MKLEIDFLRPVPSRSANDRTIVAIVWALAVLLLAWETREAIHLNQEREQRATANRAAPPIIDARKLTRRTEPSPPNAIDTRTIQLIEQAVAKARRTDRSLRLDTLSWDHQTAKWQLLGWSETAQASTEFAAVLRSITSNLQIDMAGSTQSEGGFRFEIALRKVDSYPR